MWSGCGNWNKKTQTQIPRNTKSLHKYQWQWCLCAVHSVHLRWCKLCIVNTSAQRNEDAIENVLHIYKQLQQKRTQTRLYIIKRKLNFRIRMWGTLNLHTHTHICFKYWRKKQPTVWLRCRRCIRNAQHPKLVTTHRSASTKNISRDFPWNFHPEKESHC